MSNRVRLRDPARPMLRLRESAPAPIVERLTLAEATPAKLKPTGKTGRRYRARLIEGNRWGSSGYYPAKVLERDGPTAWPSGTAMYLDHPTATDDAERPERSVRDLAATIVSTPVYEGDGLYADVEVFPHVAELVASLAPKVGLSVRGEGTAALGERAGRQGMVIESLTRGYSVDFVTKAGAGGAIVSLLESARAQGIRIREARNVGAWIESRLHLALTQLGDEMYGDGRLTREERITLSSAVGDALKAWTSRVEADAPQLFQRDPFASPEPADAALSEARLREASVEDTRQALCDAVQDAYGMGQMGMVWVRDFDPDKGLVWYDAPDDDGDSATWQQSYTVTGDPPEVTLADNRAEVIARTVYDPAPAEADDTAVGESAQGQPQPGTTVPLVEALVAPAVTTPDVTDGAPPTAPNPTETETSMSGTQNSGPAPGAAGQAEGTTQATTVNEAMLREATARAELAEQRLTEATSRNGALAESAAQQARVLAERDAAVAETRQLRADSTGRDAVARVLAEASNVPAELRPLIGPRVTDRIVGRVPLDESGTVNAPALQAAITTAIEAEATYAAALMEALGAGRVSGLGSSAQVAELSEADFNTELGAIFTDIGLGSDLAKTAAKGR